MIPLIISSPNQNAIEDYLKENRLIPKISYFVNNEGKSIGLEDIKGLIRETQYASDPSTTPTFLIENGHLMTGPAQNALLKTLEEARPEHQFIITTDNHHLLLPTIISRCRLITLKRSQEEKENEVQEIIRGLLLSPSNLISLTEEIINKGPELTIKQLLHKLHNANRNNPTTKRADIILLALNCISDLKANINPKLAIDRFLLKSNSIAKMKPANA